MARVLGFSELSRSDAGTKVGLWRVNVRGGCPCINEKKTFAGPRLFHGRAIGKVRCPENIEARYCAVCTGAGVGCSALRFEAVHIKDAPNERRNAKT